MFGKEISPVISSENFLKIQVKTHFLPQKSHYTLLKVVLTIIKLKKDVILQYSEKLCKVHNF